MERYKKKFVAEIADRFGNETIEEFIRIINDNEQIIRASYAESTDWIPSKEFVKMILRDSVFIFRFIMYFLDPKDDTKRDILFDQPSLISIIFEDLTVLENQLPFPLLTKLFEPVFIKHDPNPKKLTFRYCVLRFYGFEGKIKEDVKFRHFTDLVRHVSVMTLGLPEDQININVKLPECVESLPSADKLNCAGVDFVRGPKYLENEVSLAINFHCRILTMPWFTACDSTEKIFRNLMAFEQCHYSLSAYVCNYIKFLDFLIDTKEDVDLLVMKGVIKNCLESQESVTIWVDKIVFTGTNYYDIFSQLKEHYSSSLTTLRANMSIATLRRVYFKDLWTGTATVSAVVLLVLTLIGSVASVIQVIQNAKKSASTPPSPPPPPLRL